MYIAFFYVNSSTNEKIVIRKAPNTNPRNLLILFWLTENSSVITSDAEMYKKVPAENDKKIASKYLFIPFSIIPISIPIGVVNANTIKSTITTPPSNLDLNKFIPMDKASTHLWKLIAISI